MVITQDATSLTFELNDGSKEHGRFTFGGTTDQDVPHPDLQVTSTASWKGTTLSVRATFKRITDGTVMTERDETWSLDADARLVIETTTRRSSGQTSTTRRVYRRE